MPINVQSPPFVLPAYLFEEREDVVELGAGVRPEEPLEVRVDGGPRRRLLLRVLHVGDRLPAANRLRLAH